MQRAWHRPPAEPEYKTSLDSMGRRNSVEVPVLPVARAPVAMTPSSSSSSLAASEPAPKKGLWKRIRSAPDLAGLDAATAAAGSRVQRQATMADCLRHLDAAITFLQPHPSRWQDECGQRNELLDLKARAFDDTI